MFSGFVVNLSNMIKPSQVRAESHTEICIVAGFSKGMIITNIELKCR